MRDEALLALILKLIEERVASIPTPSRGIRGPPGFDGRDGRDFIFEEHSDKIKSWVEEFSLKFSDLTEEQLNSLRGRDGRDGRDFIFEEHEETLKSWVREFSLKFDTLTPEQKDELRGDAGRDGRDGRPGRSFVFDEHAEEITHIVAETVSAIRDDLVLKFEDLTDEEKLSLKGSRGQRGKQGKDFVFSEHSEEISSLITGAVDGVKDSLKLKFQDLSDDEKDSLKLRFEHLTAGELSELRGARGQRGKAGRDGRDGNDGQSIIGPRGPVGPVGPTGAQGKNGLSVKGDKGDRGDDAPRITEIEVDQDGRDVSLVFEFDDGSSIRAPSFELPKPGNVFNSYVSASGGGGSGDSGSGEDGKSAYEIAVENGFVGTEVEWLDSLAGENGSDATITFQSGESVLGTASTVIFGDGLSASLEANTVTVVATQQQNSSEILFNLECESSVYVGAAVYLTSSDLIDIYMSEWVTLDSVEVIGASVLKTVIKNANAATFDSANVLGLVEEKSTETLCNVRISGISSPLYSDLLVGQEYFLSSVTSGQVVPFSVVPTTPNEYVVPIGIALTPSTLLYRRGDRTKIVYPEQFVSGEISFGGFGADLSIDTGDRSNDESIVDQGERIIEA